MNQEQLPRLETFRHDVQHAVGRVMSHCTIQLPLGICAVPRRAHSVHRLLGVPLSTLAQSERELFSCRAGRPDRINHALFTGPEARTGSRGRTADGTDVSRPPRSRVNATSLCGLTRFVCPTTSRIIEKLDHNSLQFSIIYFYHNALPNKFDVLT